MCVCVCVLGRVYVCMWCVCVVELVMHACVKQKLVGYELLSCHFNAKVSLE